MYFDTSSIKCDIYESAENHRSSFPLTLNNSPIPFMVIHSNVWDLSKVLIIKRCMIVYYIY